MVSVVHHTESQDYRRVVDYNRVFQYMFLIIYSLYSWSVCASTATVYLCGRISQFPAHGGSYIFKFIYLGLLCARAHPVPSLALAFATSVIFICLQSQANLLGTAPLVQHSLLSYYHSFSRLGFKGWCIFSSCAFLVFRPLPRGLLRQTHPSNYPG